MTQLAPYEVLIVSLDTDILRREACKSQLFGWNYRFIPAVDGRSKEQSNDGLVTAPVEAIWQSHNLALREFLATDSQYCLVLEDDFAVKNPKKFEKLMSALLVEDFDLAQVGWLTTGLDVAFLRVYEGSLYAVCRVLNRLSRYSARLAKVLESKLRPRRCGQVPPFSIPDSFFPGAHAYVVSRDFAEAVLNLNHPIFLATDDFYSALSKMRSFNVFRTRKSFIGQKGDSSVGANRFTRR